MLNFRTDWRIVNREPLIRYWDQEHCFSPIPDPPYRIPAAGKVQWRHHDRTHLEFPHPAHRAPAAARTAPGRHRPIPPHQIRPGHRRPLLRPAQDLRRIAGQAGSAFGRQPDARVADLVHRINRRAGHADRHDLPVEFPDCGAGRRVGLRTDA